MRPKKMVVETKHAPKLWSQGLFNLGPWGPCCSCEELSRLTHDASNRIHRILFGCPKTESWASKGSLKNWRLSHLLGLNIHSVDDFFGACTSQYIWNYHPSWWELPLLDHYDDWVFNQPSTNQHNSQPATNLVMWINHEPSFSSKF